MFGISFLVFAGLAGLILFGAMPLIGVDPNSGVNPRDEPVRAVAFILCVLVFVSVLITLSCVAAAWVAMKRFARSEVRSEYLRFMWLPKTKALNVRVFDALFKSTDGSVASSNKSLERTRER
jgi:hypothetical protein